MFVLQLSNHASPPVTGSNRDPTVLGRSLHFDRSPNLCRSNHCCWSVVEQVLNQNQLKSDVIVVTVWWVEPRSIILVVIHARIWSIASHLAETSCATTCHRAAPFSSNLTRTSQTGCDQSTSQFPYVGLGAKYESVLFYTSSFSFWRSTHRTTHRLTVWTTVKDTFLIDSSSSGGKLVIVSFRIATRPTPASQPAGSTRLGQAKPKARA